ncbi:hypothetical protein AAG570_003535 [Ranatra chinensis]|uniref:ubiquitinyl hydrolase 1 n=1 Tax=Ranatra chinensis TaxID=642074 RepID=A0ABD0YSG4_9HEMI
MNNNVQSLTPPGGMSQNNSLCILNNAVGHLSGLEDILKDAKTSNVNVLSLDQEANNEIRFDSEKYPRIDNIRCKDNFNFNYFHDDNSTNVKRCKKMMTHYNSVSDIKDGLDLKRVKLYCSDEEDCWKGEKNKRMEMERKNKMLDCKLLEKNYRQQKEDKSLSDNYKMVEGRSSVSAVSGESSTLNNQSDETEAEKHWQSHLAANRSIIVDTFQGQFKSTVVCSFCKYVSVTYEPFMYLSVPLPNALKKQICVTHVGGCGSEVTEVIVEVNRHDNIATVKERVVKMLDNTKGNIIMGEVFSHHIAKILDDSHLVRDLNGMNRSLYSFEVITLCEELATTASEEKKDNAPEVDATCTICLEDKELNMRQHIGCTCVLCDVCVMASCRHHGGEFLECPVCRKIVHPDVGFKSLIPSSQVSLFVARMIYVPLVFRVDEVGDGNNNQKTVSLFGHPVLLKLPNRCTTELLHSALAPLVPYSQSYKVLLVDGQGTHCARCMFHAHCPGCPVSAEGPLTLYSSDTIAITFSSPVQTLQKPISHESMASFKQHRPLTLYDCIQAFSQSEQLDEQNPWFCPHCRKNQCATKTLSIWRYPDYLIVYLKRFIFYDRMSTKLEDKVMFPLQALNLDPNVPLYDLYSCVCHIGGVSAGHYTSYTQHAISKEWHYFNDSYVSKQTPQEEDYSNAYILFYKQQGIVSHL